MSAKIAERRIKMFDIIDIPSPSDNDEILSLEEILEAEYSFTKKMNYEPGCIFDCPGY